jgi:hypothetical protein
MSKKGITGHDDWVVTEALATALVALEQLEAKHQPRKHMDDIRTLLGRWLPARHVQPAPCLGQVPTVSRGRPRGHLPGIWARGSGGLMARPGPPGARASLARRPAAAATPLQHLRPKLL